ncbi:Na(+)-translocating NADH-quinone reductase subunit C [Proteobacteria bacterium 005FR1]|nr:Na(+)-translocating NADH-quinone reductase subunit C [Proteobacteria bacterium 005FR1]
MSSNDTIKKTFIVATVLCLVCAVVVSTAAVVLRPIQEQNRQADIQRNILDIAGLLEEGPSVQEQFEQVETRVINLETGTYTDEVDPDDYDQLAAARNPEVSNQLTEEQDLASISRREKYGKVYQVSENGELKTIILPIRGYGLWGTLFGFIALEAQTYDVVGLGFYEHKETPGLGGEVDNPRWREQWEGKRIYGNDLDDVEISLVKGEIQPSDPDADYKVQGLTGATLTTRGVQYMLDFWMGEQGYAKFLRNLKAGEA